MVALRVPAALGWGAMINIGLFALLASLVNVPFDGRPVPTTVINFTRLKVPTTVEPPARRPRPQLEVTPPPPGPVGPGVRDLGPTRPGRGERVMVPVFGTGIPTETTTVGVDRDPLPVVRIDPDYPPGAIRRETEGWVDVQFSVTATGAVRDVVVVDSNPKNVFDEAVIEAVARWRYNPRVEGGVPVERIGMRTRILFELDRAQAR